jgi:hypothetical protein
MPSHAVSKADLRVLELQQRPLSAQPQQQEILHEALVQTSTERVRRGSG